MKGREFKRIRESLGLTQVELAQRLRVSRQSVTFWETGRRGIRKLVVLMLAKVQAATLAEDAPKIAKRTRKLPARAAAEIARLVAMGEELDRTLAAAGVRLPPDYLNLPLEQFAAEQVRYVNDLIASLRAHRGPDPVLAALVVAAERLQSQLVTAKLHEEVRQVALDQMALSDVYLAWFRWRYRRLLP